MRIPLLGGSYEGISTNTSSQECINFYYEPPAPGESHLGALLPVHGTTLFATLANTGDIRGGLYNPIDNLLYVVSDDDFYEITSGASATDRGDLSSTSGLVYMALNPSNGEILIVDGTEARMFDVDTNTFSTVSDADFPDTANQVAFLNGYMIVNVPTTPGRFQWSNLNAASTYTSTDFSTATSLESIIKGIIEDKGILYFLGDVNGELWYNSGSSAVFERFEKINYGIVSKDTLRKFDNSVAWLARTKHGELHVVRSGQGFQPEIISTPELNRKWQELSTVNDALAYVYQLDGHEFYVLSFPTANKTWAYDASTKMWAQRSSAFSSSNSTFDGVSCAVFCTEWGGHIFGSYASTGKLWSPSTSTYTWDSTNMERRVTGPLISTDNEAQLRFSEVQIDIEEGVATGAESGNDGQLTLYYSKNGGHTYSTGTQLSLGVGSSTGYATRLVKRKLGKGRLWNFKIYTDTPRKIIVKGAYGRIYNEPKMGISNYGSEKRY